MESAVDFLYKLGGASIPGNRWIVEEKTGLDVSVLLYFLLFLVILVLFIFSRAEKSRGDVAHSRKEIRSTTHDADTEEQSGSGDT